MKEQETAINEQEAEKEAEQAYKAEMRAEIPDLWNRIEAALPEKTPLKEATVATTAKEKVVQFSGKYSKMAVLIAAAICIVFILPLLISMGGMRKSSEKAALTADMAYEESAPAEEAIIYDEEAETDTSMQKETVTTDAAPEAVGAVPVPEAELSKKEDTNMAMAAEGSAEEAVSEEAADTQSDVVEDRSNSELENVKKLFGPDALYTADVKVEIVAQSTDDEKKDQYHVFTVIILEDATKLYEEDSTYEVYVEEETSKLLEEGQSFYATIVNPNPSASSQLALYMFMQ
jgi:hypothetical protein